MAENHSPTVVEVLEIADLWSDRKTSLTPVLATRVTGYWPADGSLFCAIAEAEKRADEKMVAILIGPRSVQTIARPPYIKGLEKVIELNTEVGPLRLGWLGLVYDLFLLVRRPIDEGKLILVGESLERFFVVTVEHDTLTKNGQDSP